jgi:peptide chain release factor 2
VKVILGGIFDYIVKTERLEEIQLELAQPNIWSDQQKSELLNKERATLESVVLVLQDIRAKLVDAKEHYDIIRELEEFAHIPQLNLELNNLEEAVANLEFRRMFCGEMDKNNCFLNIQSGSGGTESQDWAEMLMRMYLRWAEKKGFETEILDYMPGEVAGIKSTTIKITGDYAYGWLRTETGVHRLVRKSPFDSGNRRHTSFAAIFITPEIDEDIDVQINPADLRIDTYRASGAGGQHVNRTDSAVRITHLPTNIVVQCQSDRSQHKNKAHALKQLKSKLYELELQKRNEDKQQMESSKSEISWGSQIRSYVLDESRIKDLRTRVEVGNTKAVLDGDLDQFIIASLKSGL